MKSALVIGGGIAGCSTAYALARHDFDVILLERHATLATEASGNPLAVLNPRLTGQDTPLEALNLHGYLHTLQLIQQLGAEHCRFHACGVIQLAHDEKSQQRLPALLRAYPDEALFQHRDASQLSAIAGVPLQHEGLYSKAAGGIHLPTLCQALVTHPRIKVRYAQVALNIERKPAMQSWQVTAGSQRYYADIVVIANANDACRIHQSAHVPLTAIRGQLSYLDKTAESERLQVILCGEGYMTPALEGLHYLGASFHAQDEDASLRTADHESNLQLLEAISPQLYEILKERVISGRVAWRSQTPDYLPVAGPLLNREALLAKKVFYNDAPASLPWLDGLYLNAGHGSKGFLSAPLCGHIIAEHAAGLTSTLPNTLLNALQPNRFLLRKLGLKQLAQHLIEAA